ncbi:MAG: TRAP transporter fused permease subunit [Thermodesulfobacteriota bacterium]|nr:TRAP transporter fused permease subunit [Thermodesulfobacteriota bacterium]
MSINEIKAQKVSIKKYRTLSGPLRWVFVSFSFFGILLSIYQLFHMDFLGVTVGDGYYYLLIGIFLPLFFLISPINNKMADKEVPWYDLLFALLSFIGPVYLFLNSFNIINEGWEIVPPVRLYILGIILIILILEAARRAGGSGFALICLFFATYALYAEYMPGLLEGYGVNLRRLVGFFTMGTEGVVGLPMKVVGNILIGYMVFAVVLQATGGGKFFLDLASALLGSLRGGPAKMSIMASAFFGSISGSSISNVLTTGAITIPTMKRTGYPAHYAGAIEAASSTGGVLMPPIMGVTAFVMAEFLAMPYYQICIAATVPSLLYFSGLFIQTDAYAARANLKGLSRDELPSVKKTLTAGWFYTIGMLFLIWALLYLHWTTLAPFWASLFLLLACNLHKETRFTWKKFLDFVESAGKVLSELVSLLCAIGVIIGALSLTGVAHSFSTEIINLAHGNIALLLILGAVTSFILGMGMTITACYVFLALILAPALVKSGLYPLSAHLFIMYWGMASYITPPVALSAFAGAGLAGSDPMKTAFKAMQLGFAKYFIPFFFVLNPAILLHGSIGNIIISFILVSISIITISYSLEGYLPKFGIIPKQLRITLFLGGLCLGFPWYQIRLIGLFFIAVSIILGTIMKRENSEH